MRLLLAFKDGMRKPVQGPFTYIEALGLVSLLEKQNALLRDCAAVTLKKKLTPAEKQEVAALLERVEACVSTVEAS